MNQEMKIVSDSMPFFMDVCLHLCKLTVCCMLAIKKNDHLLVHALDLTFHLTSRFISAILVSLSPNILYTTVIAIQLPAACHCCNFLTSNITFLYKKVGYPIKHEREIAEEGFSILLVLLLGIRETFQSTVIKVNALMKFQDMENFIDILLFDRFNA